MAKQRVHSEYFRTVSLGKRKSCPHCGQKLLPGEAIWSWGEYIHGTWGTVDHFCKMCFDNPYRGVKQRLQAHSDPCGCTFQLVGYQGEKLPTWLTLA